MTQKMTQEIKDFIISSYVSGFESLMEDEDLNLDEDQCWEQAWERYDSSIHEDLMVGWNFETDLRSEDLLEAAGYR